LQSNLALRDIKSNYLQHKNLIAIKFDLNQIKLTLVNIFSNLALRDIKSNLQRIFFFR